MSNALAPLAFQNANACFQALCRQPVPSGTVVVVGDKPMRLEVGYLKAHPVALVPVDEKSPTEAKAQGRWGRFVALLRRWTGRGATTAVTPSRRQAAAILATVEPMRRQRAWAREWLSEAVRNAPDVNACDTDVAKAVEAMKASVIAQFEPETARALASIRAIYERVPPEQANVLAQDILRPIRTRFNLAIEKCKHAGMPTKVREEVGRIVWDGLLTKIADTRVAATITDPHERATQRNAILNGRPAPKRFQSLQSLRMR